MKIKLIDTNTNKIYDSAIELYQDNNWEDYQDYCWFLETLFVEEDGFSNIKIIINKEEIKRKLSEYKVSKCCGEEAGVCFMQDGMTFDSYVCSKCNKVCDLIDLGEWFEENYVSKAEVKEKIKKLKQKFDENLQRENVKLAGKGGDKTSPTSKD